MRGQWSISRLLLISGSANVPLAVGRVSRPTASPMLFRIGGIQNAEGRNVFGGTPNTAVETTALPKKALMIGDPFPMGKQKEEHSRRVAVQLWVRNFVLDPLFNI